MYKYQGILDNPRGGYILLGKNGSGVFDEAIDIASKVITVSYTHLTLPTMSCV